MLMPHLTVAFQLLHFANERRVQAQGSNKVSSADVTLMPKVGQNLYSILVLGSSMSQELHGTDDGIHPGVRKQT